LIIAGPDEQMTKRRLHAMIEKSGIEGVELREGLFGDDKWQLICDSDLFVLPSRTENFGIVVGEALVCNVPVVMTDVGPWKAEMENYFGAGASNLPIQFVETSASGIADGLSKVMALDDETRAEMGRNGQAWIRKAFQWKRVAECMVEAYAKI
jgi:glycosyltransferase involved in cell wall biosynthesis